MPAVPALRSRFFEHLNRQKAEREDQQTTRDVLDHSDWIPSCGPRCRPAHPPASLAAVVLRKALWDGRLVQGEKVTLASTRPEEKYDGNID